ncbi:hypothetical protein IAD21_03116 [Abditibacteriota bacterium]|nr:hypothetical protein IAD21_03116 [Abditibacteriota bacterium]
MGTYDVALPETQPIVFPPLCVVCEKENPDKVIKLSFLGTKSEPVLQMVVEGADPRYYGGNILSKIDGIPVCKSCSAGLKRYHFLLKFGYYTAWIPGLVPIFLGAPQIFSVPFMIVCACSPGIYTLMRPPSFGASFIAGVANFEFKSRKVAEEFMRLNSEGIEKVKADKAEEERLKEEKLAAERAKAEAEKVDITKS